MHLPEKYLKYLPSKKFAIIIGIVAVLSVIIFAIFFMSSGSESFSITGKTKQDSAVAIGNQTVEELIQKDTDEDGIPDWEEKLWGTDPNKKITFNDTTDATYIANKKKELKIEQSVDETKLTETDKFARQFFSSYSAMKSSGQIDGDTINSFSNALGQKIVNPNLIDRYTETDVKINTTDDKTTRQKYYKDVKNLFQQYKGYGLGEEIDIISKGLAENSANGTADNTATYSKLATIGSAYQNFAKKIMELSVPQSLTDYHLRISNSANDTGISVINMQKIVSDPIIGLSGLSQYQKYSDSLVKAVADLETFLNK